MFASANYSQSMWLRSHCWLIRFELRRCEGTQPYQRVGHPPNPFIYMSDFWISRCIFGCWLIRFELRRCEGCVPAYHSCIFPTPPHTRISRWNFLDFSVIFSSQISLFIFFGCWFIRFELRRWVGRVAYQRAGHPPHSYICPPHSMAHTPNKVIDASGLYISTLLNTSQVLEAPEFDPVAVMIHNHHHTSSLHSASTYPT